jgi:hypothetical protein
LKFENLFKLDEARKTNILLSGANASGKTRLSCAIASMLHSLGYTVIVIDVSGVWKKISDLPYYTKAYKFNDEIELADFEQNTSRIYDLSTLKLSETKQVVEELSEQIWNERINQHEPNPTWLFCEESETFLKSIRGKESENTYRLVHVGRNINLRCALITTDLALLDASVIRLCGIRFHGFLNPEENSRRKFNSYYGKDYTRIAMEGLDSGDFIRFRQYYRKKPLDIITVPLFKDKPRAQLYLKFKREPEPQKQTVSLTNKIQAIVRSLI